MEHIKLRNGNELPIIGLGTWQITDRDLMSEIIGTAYKEGYRLIDSAAAYSNEIAISKAIAANGIPREDVILSDKVWNTSRRYDAVQEACKRSLKKLKTDYLDVYLIHWPASMKLYDNWSEINAETWRGMEQLYKDGLVKNIGVCNFKIHHLEELKKTAEVMPFINQVELHPGLPQKELIDYCQKEKIVIEASSPLGNGQILDNEVLNGLASKKNMSVSQICLRWGIQKELVVIPKTSKIERLHKNLDVFCFSLTNAEMKEIDSISFCGGIGIDSDEVTEYG